MPTLAEDQRRHSTPHQSWPPRYEVHGRPNSAAFVIALSRTSGEPTTEPHQWKDRLVRLVLHHRRGALALLL